MKDKAVRRLTSFFDIDSFREIDGLSPASGVVCGYGTVNDRLFFAYSQYGPVNNVHSKKICSLYSSAIKMGAPVVGILDSVGVNVEEGFEVLEHYGQIFGQMTIASGVIPMISVILGDCLGQASIIAGMSNFVIMCGESGRLSYKSPLTLKDAKNAPAGLSSGKWHFEKSGLANLFFEKEDGLFEGLREFLNYIPSNNLDEAPFDYYEDSKSINSATELYEVINNISDEGRAMFLNKAFEPSIATAFCRLNGNVVGVFGNDGEATDAAVKKLTSFVCFCDSFNIPILSLTHGGEFDLSSANCHEGLKSLSALAYALSRANVPKVNVIIGESFGGGYLLFNSKILSADICYCWETGRISPINPGVEKVSGGLEFFFTSAGDLAQIDEVISPNDTRNAVISAFEMLATKRESIPPKKHGSFLN